MNVFHLASYGEFASGQRIGPRTWSHFDLLTVHHGKLSVMIGGQTIHLSPSQAIWIYPGTRFDGYADVASRASVLHVSLPETSDEAGFARWADCAEGFASGHFSEEQLQDLDRLIRWPEGPEQTTARLALLTLVLMVIGDPHHTDSKQPDPRLEPALAQIAQRLDSPPLLAELAAVCQLSESHFRALFRESVGVSPGHFIQHQRLDLAARLLRETRLPIKAIAGRTGYAEVKHFYRAFRLRYNTTPARYRERYAPIG